MTEKVRKSKCMAALISSVKAQSYHHPDALCLNLTVLNRY